MYKLHCNVSFLLLCLTIVGLEARPELQNAKYDVLDDKEMHQHGVNRASRSINTNSIIDNENSEEKDARFWKSKAQETLNDHLNKHINTNRARNVIMFLGDGMSIPTLAAARIYLGQLAGESGEQSSLFFENFPYTGLSKTYCVNKQVADSACSATAYLCGVKANLATIGVTANVQFNDCISMANTSNHVSSIAQWAQNAGKSTGIVTTTRITHASPAGAYAHTANRDWESDNDIIKANLNPNVCPDIAAQLIRTDPGKNFKVILGGGRRKFMPINEIDIDGKRGDRLDGINLINEWKYQKQNAHQRYKYVTNRTELLDAVDDPELQSLLGLFNNDHISYHLEAKRYKEPTLTEMTEAAVKILKRNINGYFLFVESGRIDHGHHGTFARLALDETVELSKAVQRAFELVDLEDTLIVVTSDHAHTMSFAGYAQRGNDILSIASHDSMGMPFSTLSYANGPGYIPEENGRRHNISQDNMKDIMYKFPALAPLGSETHGGDDVGVFAFGPWSHLFTGLYEQNTIPHLMGFASCLGDGLTLCDIIKNV